MNFNGSRLGFWFRGDRNITRGANVLLVYDPTGLGDYYETDVNPVDIGTNISARLTALGYNPTTISLYSNIPANLSSYSQIWDIGYNSPFTAGMINSFTSYLQSGGALFLLGENPQFQIRNNDIADFIGNVGGGITSEDPNAPFGEFTRTVAAEFRLSNQTSSVLLNAPGQFDNYGRGTPMTTGGSYPETVVWKTGSLTSAPAGAIASCLDVNVFNGANLDNNFIDNLIVSLNKK